MLLFALGILAGGAPEAHAQTPTLLIAAGAKKVQLEPSLGLLVDSAGQLNIDDIEQLPDSRFSAPERGRMVTIEGALWMRFDALLKDTYYRWWLSLPLAGVDDVTLYFRDAAGQWVRQSAGDSRAISTWPLPGRYPAFAMNTPGDQPTRYYLQIRHARVPFSVMPTVVSGVQLIASQQRDHMLLGIYFGLAALVFALAMANAAAYRDLGFLSYGIYMALFATTQAALTSVTGLYAWPESPQFNNIAVFLLPMLASSAAVWFVRTVASPKRFSRALDWLMLGLMIVLPLIGLIDAFFPTLDSYAIINILIGASMLVLLMAIGVAMFEGDRHARWIALGFMPVLLATSFPLLRNVGVLSTGALTEYGMMLASSIEAPILFYGLLRRASQRRESRGRADALRTTDPLTGLLSKPLLIDKLRQALGTAERYSQPFALLVINLVNLPSLQRQHGRETGDQAMVLAAALVRAAVRAGDSVARVGDNQFALLMQGPVSSADADNVATKILASGLRPSRQLPDAEPLLFHLAVGHLDETSTMKPEAAVGCLERMQHLVADIAGGSPKAIKRIRL